LYYATTLETVSKSEAAARTKESSEGRREGTITTNEARSKMGMEDLDGEGTTVLVIVSRISSLSIFTGLKIHKQVIHIPR